MNFYNEIDPFAAAWLRELIKAGHIAPGVVDTRSIEDITPNELTQYTQCHFFAGIGVWSYALRRAGWPDDRPVWTGSCPCQPFSTAGKRKGTDDERHLWPAWFHLIQECRPSTIFGEQVEAAIRLGWLDSVQADLEGIGYALGAAGLPACGFGAPHIRQRLFFVGNSGSFGRQQFTDGRGSNGTGVESPRGKQIQFSEASGGLSNVGNAQHNGCPSAALGGRNETAILSCPEGADSSGESPGASDSRALSCTVDGTTNPERNKEQQEQQEPNVHERGRSTDGPSGCGPLNGYWQAAEWLYCGDEKYRPIEPGTLPLVNGATNRVGRLRGYGNAIVAPVAEAFIRSFIETEKEGVL